MMQLVLDRLDDVVLARAALVKSKGTIAEAAIAAALRPLSPASFDDASWSAAIAESLDRLRRANLVDGGHVTAGAAQAATRRLGLPRVTTWKQIVDRTLPALALGVDADDARAQKRLSDRDQVAGAIVARAEGLWRDGPPPSPPAVADALVWRSLHLAGNPKRTPPEIRAHFLGQLLGTSGGPADRMLRQLAAKATGAVRADLQALRAALARRWLCGMRFDAPAARTNGTSLESFASAVRTAAARATTGLFGDRKVFIAAAWRAVRDDPSLGTLSLDDFKERLIAAHRAGLVRLARADLTSAMDPDAVAQSETRHLEARYHFIDRGTP
jgi:hypothetical protein